MYKLYSLRAKLQYSLFVFLKKIVSGIKLKNNNTRYRTKLQQYAGG